MSNFYKFTTIRTEKPVYMNMDLVMAICETTYNDQICTSFEFADGVKVVKETLDEVIDILTESKIVSTSRLEV